MVKSGMSFGTFGINCKKPIFFCLFRTRLPLLFLNLFVSNGTLEKLAEKKWHNLVKIRLKKSKKISQGREKYTSSFDVKI